MAAPERAHTAELSQSELGELRRFLEQAFDGDFAEEDWEHTLGGVHVIVRDDAGLAAHASVVQRRLAHRGIGIRTGYVEAVAVRRERRGAGLGALTMSAAEQIVRAAYDLGALSAGEVSPFYERRDWVRWAGPSWVLSPDGPMRTEEEDGGVFVLTTPTSPELDFEGALACDWRPGDVW